ncbi:glycine/betaine ABC transporter substrate-binding protein [Streptomyces armeniacus]|uniref:Glycine/betaine ABC transporter substrate-binding protein n=1 Tax=Streptomyces armeniacus TaxID=83291 RepID=A0A345XIV7_9ACTN|nr:ABC transporter substrate-binding protein [Streptomyces armeniacus]AXK31573.1 glycine/betaine ABC transporter substrate-binding protein [Streptomyces armeniacus]
MSIVKKSRTVLMVLALLSLSACSDSDPGGKDTVTLVSPAWANGKANTAVAAYLLEQELGYDVEVLELDEAEAWKALGDGRADAILEDWGHPAEEKKYVQGKKTVVPGGDLGVTGRIGWYVPQYLADKHKDITSWHNLNDYADLLATPGTGGKGRLLEGSRSFVTHDEALIRNLNLDYKAVFLGSEGAQIKEMRKRADKKEPFLTYWWRPHWIETEVPLAEVLLPTYTTGCADNEKMIKCGYPTTKLQKFFNAEFAKDGGKAHKFLKNFTWQEDDQNAVAKMIVKERLSERAAAKRWVEQPPQTWRTWFMGI